MKRRYGPPLFFIAGVGVAGGVWTVCGAQVAGGVLEMLGVLLVGFGLWRRRQDWAPGTGYGARLYRWLRSTWLRLSGRAKDQTISAAASSIKFGVSASGVVTGGVPPEAPIEQRVAALEENLRQHKAKTATNIADLRAVDQRLAENLSAERRERAAGDDSIKGKLETIALDDLGWEWVGFWWVFIGLGVVTFA